MSTPPGSQAITEQEERARRLFSSHQYAEAALAYAALARAEPTCGKWLTNEAKCHHHLNKVVTALNCCRKSMEVDPPWSRAYEIAAQCLLRVLRHNGAYEVLTQGMRLAPSPAIEKLLRETRVALYKDQVGMTGYDPEVAAQVAQGLVEVYDPQGRSAVLERAMWEVYEDTSDRARFAAAKAKNHRILRADTWRSWLRRARDLYEAGDWEEYLSFLEWCAEDDCPFAMTSLAVHHMRGDVAPADPASGVLWARRCIELGPDPACVAAGTTDEYLTDCQQALSTAYRHGIGGVEKDMDQAERWLRAAADAGDAVAMNNLARLLEELGRPPEEAVEWLLRSARAGCTVAARNLGKHYERGEGCPRDHEEAARWYGVAAEGGELDGVDCLVSLGLEQGSRLSTIMLGDARRHVKVLREREEGDGGASGAGGVARGGLGRGPVQDMGGGGATGRLARMLATEARLCLEIGLCRYADMSVRQLWKELGAAGEPMPPSFEVFFRRRKRRRGGSRGWGGRRGGVGWGGVRSTGKGFEAPGNGGGDDSGDVDDDDDDDGDDDDDKDDDADDDDEGDDDAGDDDAGDGGEGVSDDNFDEEEDVGVAYRLMLVRRLMRSRRLTQLEREAAELADRAHKLAMKISPSSSPSSSPALSSAASRSAPPSSSFSTSSAGPGDAARCSNLDRVAATLMQVGIRFHAKGRKAEAYERFLLPSAKLGDAQGCYVAGRHLAEVGTSAKELQAAQRFLSQAVASDVPGAQDELDALTARLARGGDLHGASPLNAGGDTFDGGSGGQGGSQVDGQHEEKAAAVTAAAIAVEAPGMQAIEGEVEVHCTQGSEDGAEDCAMGDGTGGSLAAAAATPGAAGGASSASGGVGAGAGTKTCWGCKARVASLRRCGGCRRAGYCSRECQKKHWKEGHREACAQLAA